MLYNNIFSPDIKNRNKNCYYFLSRRPKKTFKK